MVFGSVGRFWVHLEGSGKAMWLQHVATAVRRELVEGLPCAILRIVSGTDLSARAFGCPFGMNPGRKTVPDSLRTCAYFAFETHNPEAPD